jgi:predicted HD phosphohydrolase
VLALADALDRVRTLTGPEIDEAISNAITQAEHEREMARRAWLAAAKSRAEIFLAKITQEQV